MKIHEFWLRFHWSLFPRVQLKHSSIGSCNGLAPNRQQAITWTNAYPVHWRVYAAFGVRRVKTIKKPSFINFFYYIICRHGNANAFQYHPDKNIFNSVFNIMVGDSLAIWGDRAATGEFSTLLFWNISYTAQIGLNSLAPAWVNLHVIRINRL